jgi:hypothetical protein
VGRISEHDQQWVTIKVTKISFHCVIYTLV